MESKCQICGESIASERHFSAKHKINQAEYYTKYYPKFDLYTKEPIVFKDRDQYFKTFFNTKINMINWLKNASLLEAYEFIKKVFDQRIKEKQLQFAPSHVELKSIETLPNMIVINKILGDYYKFLEKEFPTLKRRFSHKQIACLKRSPVTEIAVDTREQKPLVFKNVKTRSMKLDYGDYTSFDQFQNIFIDRKNPSDFISTFTVGYDRFEKELNRAAAFGAYIVVLVEQDFDSMYHFDKTFLGRFTKSSPQRLFHNVRELLQNYDNFQILFVANRYEASRYVNKIFEYGEEIKSVDLQYMHDITIF